MECDILDSLEQVGYEGSLLDESVLVKAAEGGLGSTDYVSLCMWLASQLKPLCDLEESISSGPDDMSSLQFEMSGLLKELHCPHDGLVSGILQGDLLKKTDYLKLLMFLCSELQAAHVVHNRLVPDMDHEGDNSTEHDLQTIMKTLALPESTQQDVAGIFSDIENKINDILRDLPAENIEEPVLKSSLSSEQWEKLENINTALASEYECRRRMLIKRLDVTVQSFGWSERAKVRVDSMARAYQPKRHSLLARGSVGTAELLAAREDICNLVKTSSGSSRENTACAVNKILMGNVPDRGGRPSEIEAPRAEMPAWQKRRDGGGGGGWRGGGDKGGRGGWGRGGVRGGGGGRGCDRHTGKKDRY
ncbi:protein FAM98B [Aplochiton taeniatus]